MPGAMGFVRPGSGYSGTLRFPEDAGATKSSFQCSALQNAGASVQTYRRYWDLLRFPVEPSQSLRRLESPPGLENFSHPST